MLRAAIAALAVFLLTTPAYSHQKVDKKILDLIENDDAAVPDKSNAARIRRGRNLFLNGTFNGNGRTCGTCHEPTNNFTIDPAFIATLPQSSPLFVAENNPTLKGLEDPTLVRLGLICENLDGFPVPATLPSTSTCVFRSVPHTFALRTSIDPRADFTLVNSTGWGGDGSPGDGSLRNFAVGAVVQHMPKDQRRRAKIDFRVPKKNELRDLEAFQLSLGRQTELDLSAMTFADPAVEAGKTIFVAGVPGRLGTVRSCNGCHGNAGANDANGDNRQFNTGVARRPDAPACISTVAPGDGGFASSPTVTTTICSPVQTVVFRGDGTFSTPSVIEAADTLPSFHNGTGSTLKEAIRHYTTDAFNESAAGGNNAFELSNTQVNQLSALLLALNASENVRNGIVVDRRALTQNKSLGDKSLQEARSETLDAIGVLRESPTPIYQNTTIVRLLSEAARLELRAIGESGATRKTTINAAIAMKGQARAQFTN